MKRSRGIPPVQAGLLILALLWGCGLMMEPGRPAFAQSSPTSVIVNEIFYQPAVDNQPLEFVELHNPTDVTVDLSRWALQDAVNYRFPIGTLVQAGGFVVVAQDPIQFEQRFGVSALGPFEKRLSAEGERVVLYDRNASPVDEVTYGLGFPWPVAGGDANTSIQLMHPSLDNSLGGYWRSGQPSPARANVVYSANPPPLIRAVSHEPASPRSHDVVRVAAAVSDPDGVSLVELLYQDVAPGAYISLTDPAYQSEWTALPMQQTSDGLYTADLPADLQRHRHLIRYRIRATDARNVQITVPYGDDPQPNFAYFVYDVMPTWDGSVDGGSAGRITYDFAKMRPLPVYHLIARQSDVADAFFMPNSTRAEGYMGNDYPWRGTFVYDGKVYDHISFRARGGETRYATGKNMLKFNFNRGHRLQAFDNYGRPYATQWDKLNLSAVIQQTHRRHRGEQGMFESLAFRLFNLAGVEAPHTHFVHLRVVDAAAEQGASQYEGDFWGLYLAIEQMDGRFLAEHGLPDGNLYKMENWTGELNNLGTTGVSSKSDLNAFLGSYSGWPDAGWWRTNLDLDRYYSYRAVVEAIHHYDIDEGKNYFYFLNPETDKWSVHPWDLDLTWSYKMPGSGAEPFRDRVFSHPAFRLEYENRMRELRDLLFNSEQVGWLIEEYSALINSAGNGRTMVDADRALWDHNPIFLTRYVDPGRTQVGHFYRIASSENFEGMLALMAEWTEERSGWIDREILIDRDYPQRPIISYQGPPGYPADHLTFSTSGFTDPQGDHTFGAIQWRVAQVAGPGSRFREPNGPVLYEIDAAWQSEIMPVFSPIFTFPKGSCPPKRRCRARVRLMDESGRWSHWSEPVDFEAGVPSDGVVQGIRISEIMYNPLNQEGIPGSEYEFIELQNVGPTGLDLTNMWFSSGIRYTFPVGSRLDPQAYLILVRDSGNFAARYGFQPHGEYDSRLANEGERITLNDAFGRTVLSVAYDDAVPWPTAADGQGYSLVPARPHADPVQAEGWRSSSAIGGSPGAADPLPILVNEVLANPGGSTAGVIELHNPTDQDADIGGWYLSHERGRPHRFRIAPGTILSAGGYRIFGAQAYSALADVKAAAGDGLAVSAQGGELFVFSATEAGRLTGYRHGFAYGASVPDISMGRFVDSSGREHFVAQSRQTLGSANAGPATGSVVISEIMYHPVSGHEYVELVNRSSEVVRLYDADFPNITWRISGMDFYFPPGIEMAPGERLIVVPLSPADHCASQSTARYEQFVGPFDGLLADDGRVISLDRPVRTTAKGASAYVAVDVVAYDNVSPWPSQAAGRGAALGRLTLEGFGAEPANWQAVQHDPPAAAGQTGTMLCSFEVVPQEAAEGAGIDEGSPGSISMAVVWSAYPGGQIAGYSVWRGTTAHREDAELLTPIPIPVWTDGSPVQTYRFVDSNIRPEEHYFYWLEGEVNGSQERENFGFRGPLPELQRTLYPLFRH